MRIGTRVCEGCKNQPKVDVVEKQFSKRRMYLFSWSVTNSPSPKAGKRDSEHARSKTVEINPNFDFFASAGDDDGERVARINYSPSRLHEKIFKYRAMHAMCILGSILYLQVRTFVVRSSQPAQYLFWTGCLPFWASSLPFRASERFVWVTRHRFFMRRYPSIVSCVILCPQARALCLFLWSVQDLLWMVHSFGQVHCHFGRMNDVCQLLTVVFALQ